MEANCSVWVIFTQKPTIPHPMLKNKIISVLGIFIQYTAREFKEKRCAPTLVYF